MIVPSIDIMNGEAVQLRHGKEVVLTAGDPRPIARKFGRVGEIAVIDLDAAMNVGSNAQFIRELCSMARCRVGGGIRTPQQAKEWLNAGACRVILGTAANPETLSALPAERVIAALDGVHGKVVVDGWRRQTGQGVIDQIRRLHDHVGGFLVTFVEREGALGGTDMDAAKAIREAAGTKPVTVAGGITTCDEIRALDEMGVDAQVGMALYTERITLANSVACLLHSDRPDGLWPTVVVDEQGGALGLAYSSLQSLHEAIESGTGVYQSRTRGLWKKGQTSGDCQQLIRIDLDCDRDCLRFMVRQSGTGFCHRGTRTCWGAGTGILALEQRLQSRLREGSKSSYTSQLARDPELLRGKLMEEAAELAEAAQTSDEQHVVHEAADLLYFLTTALLKGGGTYGQVLQELDRRALAVTHRHGKVKPPASSPGKPSSAEKQT